MSDSEISLTQPLANQERNRERQQALFRDSSPIERDVEPARKRPRFLGDGASDDDEDTETNARQRPRQRREDPHNLDNLFQGLDDLPDDDDRPPARVELKSTISAKQREQMLNGVLNNNDIDKPVDASNIDEAIDAGGKKKRAPRVKLDAERLLGAKGFPLLIEQAKKFKVGPKGSEVFFLAIFRRSMKTHTDNIDMRMYRWMTLSECWQCTSFGPIKCSRVITSKTPSLGSKNCASQGL